MLFCCLQSPSIRTLDRGTQHFQLKYTFILFINNIAVSSQPPNHLGEFCESLSCLQTTRPSFLARGPKQPIEMQLEENRTKFLLLLNKMSERPLCISLMSLQHHYQSVSLTAFLPLY